MIYGEIQNGCTAVFSLLQRIACRRKSQAKQKGKAPAPSGAELSLKKKIHSRGFSPTKKTPGRINVAGVFLITEKSNGAAFSAKYFNGDF